MGEYSDPHKLFHHRAIDHHARVQRFLWESLASGQQDGMDMDEAPAMKTTVAGCLGSQGSFDILITFDRKSTAW